MSLNDPFVNAKKPCGCHDVDLVEPRVESIADLPSVAEVEAALAQLGGASSPEGLELELAALDSALSEAETFEIDHASPAIGMEDLLALVERYPGLKITLSF